jgi:hypothetical protein
MPQRLRKEYSGKWTNIYDLIEHRRCRRRLRAFASVGQHPGACKWSYADRLQHLNQILVYSLEGYEDKASRPQTAYELKTVKKALIAWDKKSLYRRHCNQI